MAKTVLRDTFFHLRLWLCNNWAILRFDWPAGIPAGIDFHAQESRPKSPDHLSGHCKMAARNGLGPRLMKPA